MAEVINVTEQVNGALEKKDYEAAIRFLLNAMLKLSLNDESLQKSINNLDRRTINSTMLD